MSSQVSTKVRLVRCPKCRQVLPELPEVLLYKCGGCGIVLQAKNPKDETNSTEQTAEKSNYVAKSREDNVLDVSDGISSSLEILFRLDEDSPVEAKESSNQEIEKTLRQNPDNLHEHEDDEKSRNCVIDQNDAISQSPEPIIRADDEIEGLFTFRSSSSDKNVSSNVKYSNSFVSFYLSSPDEKKTRNFERVRDGTNYTRAESYYRYDGGESSCDETHDRILERISRPFVMIKDPDGLRNRDFGENKTRLAKQGVVSSRFRFSDTRPEKPSSYRRNLGPTRPEPPTYSQPDKMDILRTVCELEEQLSRMRFPTNRRAPLEKKYARFHYNHPEKYDSPRQRGWSEKAHYRHQVNCWHYSGLLPSNCMNCRNGHCIETKLRNQRHRDDEVKRLCLKKRHIRPVAGGAPFVTCYYCLELLKLPADVFIFEKRYHRVMCNACRKILKFSVLGKSKIVPYCNDESYYAPPPSEAGE